MPVPLLPEKLGHPSILDPSVFANHNAQHGWMGGHDAPESAILLFHKGLAEAAAERHPYVRATGFLADFYLLDAKTARGGTIAVVANFGIGAPAAAFVTEDLASAGVRTIVGVGTSGGLAVGGQPGDVIVVDEALRDEGTSYHYLPDGERVFADASLREALAAELADAGISTQTGACWTTDAPYRETAIELRAHRAAGVLAVEMEAAALFAVAKTRGLRSATLLTVSDVLEESEWTPDFHAEPTIASLNAMLDAAIAVLSR